MVALFCFKLFSKAEFGEVAFLIKIYLFLERGEGREKERDRNIDRLPLTCTLTRGPNPGMCPNRDANQ